MVALNNTPVELLHTFAPDTARREAVKVWDTTAEHLTYEERQTVGRIADELETLICELDVRAMQHCGPVGDALDFASTIACAGEAMARFMLSRPLVNPVELAAAKVAMAECCKWSGEARTKLDTDEDRHSMAGLAFAIEFTATGAPLFEQLFNDLEANAVKRFPHLAANDNKGG